MYINYKKIPKKTKKHKKRAERNTAGNKAFWGNNNLADFDWIEMHKLTDVDLCNMPKMFTKCEFYIKIH